MFYHVFNRGVDHRNIFMDVADRQRFLLTIHTSLLENSPQPSNLIRLEERQNFTDLPSSQVEKKYGPAIVKIISFCLMTNHYHLLVNVEEPEHLSKFMQRLGNSYTCYFNEKYSRKGRLFESKYKSVPVESQAQLNHLTRYIHTNPSNTKKNRLTPSQLQRYLWSSLPQYLNKTKGFCKIDDVMDSFKTPETFWQFTKDGIRNVNEFILSQKTLIDYY